MKLYVGTSGYSYKEWKGLFYPERISPKEMLRFYSQHLGTVEINNTFHRMPTEKLLTSWSDQVPDHFVFGIKAPQVITHVKRLKNVEEETEYLFRTLSVLGPRLGPVLFQFPKSFRTNLPLLQGFLNLIPRGVYCALAFRSSSWLNDEALDLMRERGCSLCVEDTDEEPAGAIVGTAAWGYLRLRRSDYSDVDLSRWAEKVLSQGWERAFVFFKHEDEAKAPQYAVRFRQLIDAIETSQSPIP